MNTSSLYIELTSRGFERITHWEPHKERIRPNSLKWKDSAGWIYAFVAEGKVRYVGITTMVLRSRLDAYSHHINDKVREHITACLLRGQLVEIFGMRRPRVEKIDLEREESRLMKEFGADWNVRE